MKHRNLTVSVFFLTAVTGLCAMRATVQNLGVIKDGINYQTLTEQIEIMRRVWTHAVSDKFAELLKEDQKNNKDESKDGAGEDEAADGSAPSAPRGQAIAPVVSSDNRFGTVWQSQVAAITGADGQYELNYSATSDTRGLYLPGHGVVYSTDIQVPLKATTPDEAGDNKGNSDAWDEARNSVRTNSDTAIYTLTGALNRRGAKAGNSVYVMDERYIDSAVDSILTSIAKYGSRIDQLPGAESITVAIRLNPGSRNVFFYSGIRSYTTTSGGDEDQVGRLVIEVPHAALGKDLDAAQLKSQCKITRY